MQGHLIINHHITLRKDDNMSILNLFSLEGKNAIVIGACGGLGKGIATGLAEAGASVFVAGRKKEKCDHAASSIAEDTGGTAYGLPVDITIQDSIDEMIAKAEERAGKIHILVNSAGINIRKPALQYSRQDWDTVQDIQLKGSFFTCQAAARHMIKNSIPGRIINIASVNSKIVARPDIVSYVSAKAGIMQMTKALAAEWAQYGILVNAIAPGFFETELTKVLFEDKTIKQEMLSHIPQKRFGNPDQDLAGMAVYLSSDAASYIPGQTIYIDGGYTII